MVRATAIDLGGLAANTYYIDAGCPALACTGSFKAAQHLVAKAAMSCARSGCPARSEVKVAERSIAPNSKLGYHRKLVRIPLKPMPMGIVLYETRQCVVCCC